MGPLLSGEWGGTHKMHLEVQEAAKLKTQLAIDRFLHPQAKVNQLAWPVTQLEKACRVYTG